MFRMPRRLAATATIAVLVPLAVAGCAKDDTSGSASGGATSGGSGGSSSGGAVKLLKEGTLQVCTHSGFKPFEYPDAGKVVGFDVDLSDAIAKKIGATTQIVDIPFDQITSGAAFAAKRCDMGAAGMTITDARKAAIGISDPYFNSTQALLVKKDSSVAQLTDLKGKKLGVQTDTTGKDYAEKNVSANGYTTVVFEDAPSLGNAVKSGAVDAGLNDNFVMVDFVKGNADTKVATEIDTGEKYGLAFPKDNTALLNAANDVLKTMKSDGSYDTMYEKWIGTKPSSK